jgi:hypothetical protein
MDSTAVNRQLNLLCTRADRAKPGAHREWLIERIEEYSEHRPSKPGAGI